jgi:hypothetical protein
MTADQQASASNILAVGDILFSIFFAPLVRDCSLDRDHKAVSPLRHPAPCFQTLQPPTRIFT